MAGTDETIPLRPLGLGEILDRAITLLARNYLTFALIGLAYIVPLMVMQYFASAASADSFQQMIDEISHPGRVPVATTATLPWGWILASFSFSLVCSPFVNVAFASAVARVYGGQVPDWRECYGTGLRRAGAVLIATLLAVVVVSVAVFAGAIAFGLAAGLAILAVRGVPAVGVVIVILLIVAGLAWLLFLGLGFLALGFMIYGVAIEDAGVGAAFSRALARIFARTELGKALLICLSLFAVYIGNFALSGGVALLLSGVVRVRLLDTVAQGILELCFLAFAYTLVAVYYFDVRVRREGLDIAHELEELDAPSLAG